MIAIEQGKIFIRRLRGADSAVVGVVAVPTALVPERLYSALLTDQSLMFEEASRAIPKDYLPDDGKEFFGARECSPAGLVMQRMFGAYMMPGAMDFILRDTELPNAPHGCKWVIAVGASRSHDGASRMLTFHPGQEVAVELGELGVGESIDGVLREPLWGDPADPCALVYQLELGIHDRFLALDRARNHEPEFKEFLQEMEARMPSRTWYTRSEMEARDAVAKEVILKIRPDLAMRGP